MTSAEMYQPAKSAVGLLESDSQPRPHLQPVPPAEPKCKVLVLEDDDLQLQVLTRHLQALDLQVLSAKTVEAAAQILRDNALQLAILDINLPDGSGLNLCERMDLNPLLAGLPKIVLSSLTNADLVRQTRAAGGCFFIGKPYDPNVLLAIIERALGTELQ